MPDAGRASRLSPFFIPGLPIMRWKCHWTSTFLQLLCHFRLLLPIKRTCTGSGNGKFLIQCRIGTALHAVPQPKNTCVYFWDANALPKTSIAAQWKRGMVMRVDDFFEIIFSIGLFLVLKCKQNGDWSMENIKINLFLLFSSKKRIRAWIFGGLLPCCAILRLWTLKR